MPVNLSPIWPAHGQNVHILDSFKEALLKVGSI